MTNNANINLKAVVLLIIYEDYTALRKIAINTINLFNKLLLKVNKRLKM